MPRRNHKKPSRRERAKQSEWVKDRMQGASNNKQMKAVRHVGRKR